jgi:hypothetical protein
MEIAILLPFKNGKCQSSIPTQKRQLLGGEANWGYKYTSWEDITNTPKHHIRDQIHTTTLETQLESTRSRIKGEDRDDKKI